MCCPLEAGVGRSPPLTFPSLTCSAKIEGERGMKVEELLHYSLNVRIVKWWPGFISTGEPEELQGEGKVSSHGIQKFLQTVETLLSICTEVAAPLMTNNFSPQKQICSEVACTSDFGQLATFTHFFIFKMFSRVRMKFTSCPDFLYESCTDSLAFFTRKKAPVWHKHVVNL